MRVRLSSVALLHCPSFILVIDIGIIQVCLLFGEPFEFRLRARIVLAGSKLEVTFAGLRCKLILHAHTALCVNGGPRA